jgi:hypothetical protein
LDFFYSFFKNKNFMVKYREGGPGPLGEIKTPLIKQNGGAGNKQLVCGGYGNIPNSA